MSIKTIKGVEQGRAEYAYKCAVAGQQLGAKKGKEYKAYVKKIPAMIKANGLGAAFAFVFSKGSNGGRVDSSSAYGLIYSQIATWLLDEDNAYFLPDLKNVDDLVKAIIALDSAEYRNLTVEVLALMGWTKRFADGLISGEDG
jgi:CRISPR-associated protein Cmr5